MQHGELPVVQAVEDVPAPLARAVPSVQPPLVAALPFRIGAPEVASFPYAQWDRLTRQLDGRERQRLARIVLRFLRLGAGRERQRLLQLDVEPLLELARLEAASRERWTTFRPFLATRENPAGTVDRATIDAAVEEAHAKARSAAA